MNYKLLDILSKVRCMALDHIISWAAMHQKSVWKDDPEKIARREAADAFAHNFVGHILSERAMDMTQTDEPGGAMFRFRCYAFTREQLLELMEKVWAAGQKDGMERSPNKEENAQGPTAG